jgi:hypothetical protein
MTQNQVGIVVGFGCGFWFLSDWMGGGWSCPNALHALTHGIYIPAALKVSQY